MFERDIRESMRKAPAFAQPVLTWITGKPLDITERRFVLARVPDVILTLVLCVSCVAALLWISAHPSDSRWLAVIGLWLLLVGLLRKIQVTHLHHAIHNRLFNQPRLNRLYARAMPSLIFVQNSVEYRKEHLEHHSSETFTTRRDSDAAFLAMLGFQPGRTRGELWLNLWLILLSPAFHLLFARARLTSVFLRNGRVETLLAVLAAGLHIACLVTFGWAAYLIAVFVPMFVLYHVSALLQFLTEHAWDVTGVRTRNWAEYSARCWGRFCGEAYPQRKGTKHPGGALIHAGHVGLWLLKMTLFHLPVRLACLVSDLPAHDWHHLAHIGGQSSRDWTYSLHLRQAAIADGDRAGFGKRELWGLRRMIEHQFRWLESVPVRHDLPPSLVCEWRERSAMSNKENEDHVSQ
jgi:hypothetical protein